MSTLNSASSHPTTRIENQTEALKAAANRISGLTARNVEHARQLGYFEPPKDAGQTPSPVVLTLDDALHQLLREIDALEGSMNLFN